MMSDETLGVTDITEILRLLPHRYPFLLIDRVIDIRGEDHGTPVSWRWLAPGNRVDQQTKGHHRDGAGGDGADGRREPECNFGGTHCTKPNARPCPKEKSAAVFAVRSADARIGGKDIGARRQQLTENSHCPGDELSTSPGASAVCCLSLQAL